MIQVSLTPSEIMSGALNGIMRHLQDLQANRKPAYGVGNDNDWQCDIEGALGELAYAKATGKYCAGVGTFRGDDVGGSQVRTASQHYYCLILHKEDPDSKPFILLTGVNGKYVIRGWLIGHEGKKQEYWKDPVGGRPAFFVPQSVLHDMAELEEWATAVSQRAAA